MSKELTEKQKALIKKVQALAERGVGGEKETAEKKPEPPKKREIKLEEVKR